MNNVESQRRFLVAVILVGVLLASCQASGTSETTGAPAAPTTSPSAPSVPATSAPAPSTAPPTTTPETTPPTTTTVTAPATTLATTTTIGGGGWAEFPAVVSAWGALGWWDGSGWVPASDEPAADLIGRYRMVGLGEELEATADSVGTFCALEAGGEQLLPVLPWGEFDPIPRWSVAVSAPWDLQSRLEVIDSQPDVYRSAVRDFLATRGLTVADPEIVQVLKTDLQNDGTDEVIVVAESITEPESLSGAVGDYSVAFLRVVVEGEVQTAVLGESIVARGQEPYILSFRVPALADLNGDGTTEIAVIGRYYEGSGISIFEYVDHDIGPVSVLGVGCGV